MDLMRTLLIYMSATMTLAVQSTSAPKETPTPSPVPENAVVETVSGAPSAGQDVITPAPKAQATEKITPAPVPLITPNQKAYHNLIMGARGKEVKKLQEKLIELGYLKEGAADGAYGRQTLNAVKKFQYYNGLTADGIAGRSTQTNLFENPEVVPNPEKQPDPTDTPAPTPAPETIAPPTEAPETEAPVTEAPVTEAPVTEAPVTEAPVTEAPVTEAPAETEKPAEEATATPEPELPEIIENVDLDADIYEPINGMVALNEGDGPLEFVAMEDGVPVTAHPRLSQNGARIRVSLEDLCECVEGWTLTDDGTGAVVLEAAGYTLVLYNEDSGCSATLDGTEIPMKDDDYDFSGDGHFINAEFLATALKGEAAWDQEESTLMLRILNKDAVQAGD